MKDFDLYLTDLAKLISYKSVCSSPSENAPFGQEVKDCLDYFLSIADRMGLKTIDYDGYAGEVVLGEGEEIGIIGHLDVVPTGIGWLTPPFSLTEKDGIFYGRGVSDDKTPLLSCLYALKELKDSNLPINKKFRLILGCDEETEWRDVEYIKTKTTLPEYGFSPDGAFPLSYAEKGIVELSFLLPPLKNFTDVKGGTVLNAVCDYAVARPVGFTPSKTELEKFNLKLENGLIVSRGKSAHGSTPELGKNALKPLFEYFLSVGEDVKSVLDYVFYDKLGVCAMQNEQGFVTMSPDLICQDEKGIKITCDVRIPAPLSKDDLIKKLNQFNIDYTAKLRHEPVMTQKKSPFITTLLGAYNSVTGENAQPFSMGGSTFARAFKKGCSFGPHFANHQDNIHDANENVSRQQILSAYEIYKKAIFDLAK